MKIDAFNKKQQLTLRNQLCSSTARSAFNWSRFSVEKTTGNSTRQYKTNHIEEKSLTGEGTWMPMGNKYKIVFL